MQQTRPTFKKILLFLFFLISPFIFTACECDFSFLLPKKPVTITSPVLTCDEEEKVLEWYAVKDATVYDVCLDGEVLQTLNLTTSKGVFDYSNYVANNTTYTFEIIAKATKNNKTITSTSNKIIINNTPSFLNDNKSKYNFVKSTSPVSVNLSGTELTWGKDDNAIRYIVRTFTNTYGYKEFETTATTFDFNSANLCRDHEIIAYSIAAVYDDSSDASIISSMINYYDPDGDYYTIFIFDGYIWDYYINSKDELNAVVYYNFIKRDEDYYINFDPDYVNTFYTSTIFKTKNDAINDEIEQAINRIYETSYMSHYKYKTYSNVTDISTLKFNVSIYFFGITQCDTTIDADTQYLYTTHDTGLAYYENYDYETNGHRDTNYDDYVSDKYMLQTPCLTSEQLFHAVENKVTPIVAHNSRAELIYNSAKQVLNSIISDSMSDYEKALTIFDWITFNTRYDYGSLQPTADTTYTKNCCYYLEGVFIKNVAVCDGFSKAYSLMCNMEGIDCLRIVGTASSGSSSGGHAWNKVKIDGDYYVVDITWTEIMGTQSVETSYGDKKEVKTEMLSHKYFLVSENAIGYTHSAYEYRDKYFMYPTKLNPPINYFKQNNVKYMDKNGEEIFVQQYVADSDSLLNVLNNPLYTNCKYVEFALDSNYLLGLAQKHSTNDPISAFQQEIRAIKFNPQLIMQNYDTYREYINFIQYGDEDIATVVIFATSLLVNEEGELERIINEFGDYAIYNTNVLDYVIEVGIDASYIQAFSNTDYPYENLDKNINDLMNNFVSRLQDVKCEFEISPILRHEDTLVNEKSTRIYYFTLSINSVSREKLDSPVIELDNDSITWQPVENATCYDIYYNDNQILASNITDTHYQLSLTERGEYDIWVVAKNDQEQYVTSNASNIVRYTILPDIDLSVNSTTIKWDRVDYATSYQISISGYSNVITIEDDNSQSYEYDLANYITNSGTYNITVRAICNQSENNANKISNQVSIIRLDAPAYINFDKKCVYFPQVQGAIGYELAYRDSNGLTVIGTVEDTNLDTYSYDLSNLRANNSYNIIVKAYNNQSTPLVSYLDSDYTGPITFYVLEAPTISFNGTTLNWTNYSDSCELRIYRGNTYIASTTNSTYDMTGLHLTAGTYAIKAQCVTTQDGYNDSQFSTTINYTVLAAPHISYVTNNRTTVAWNTVTQASSYYITFVNGSNIITATVTSTQFDVSSVTYNNTGIWTMSVVAQSSADACENSSASNTVNVYKLSTPNISFSSTTLTWNSVTYANQYTIYSDNTALSTVTNTSINLASYISVAGLYNIHVVASNTGYGYITSSSNHLPYTQLATPTLSDNGNYIISWNNAKPYGSSVNVEYKIYINNEYSTSTSNISFDLSSSFTHNGIYSIYVVATTSDNGASSGTASNTVTITFTEATVLDTPALRADIAGKQVTWEEVSDATSYDIYIDNSKRATTSNLYQDLSNLITDSTLHTIYVIAKSTNSESDASNTVNYANNTGNTLTIGSYSINENIAVGPVINSSITVSSQTISWSTIEHRTSYIIAICTDSNTYYFLTTNSTSVTITNIYSSQSINTSKIFAYMVITNIDGNYYIYNTSHNYYHNPETNVAEEYRQVYAFDGELHDYYITSQEELNNLVYYHFIYRKEYTSSGSNTITFATNTSISNNIYSNIPTAFDSFFESHTSFSYSITSSNSLITLSTSYNNNATECNTNFYNTYGYTKYDNYSYNNAYYDSYNFTDSNSRDTSYDNFASDNKLVHISVDSSEEMYHAVEDGFTPVCIAGSRAETIYNKAKAVLRNIIANDMTDYEKALCIYDWIAVNTMYNRNYAYYDDATIMQNPQFYLEGIFWNDNLRIGVCDAFSKAYSLLCNMEGIECIKISGEAIVNPQTTQRGGHAWNKVKVDGNYYAVDITWTEFTANLNSTTYEMLEHKYFLVSDSYISDHYPHAARTKFNNYTTPTNPYSYWSNTAISNNSDTCNLIVTNVTDLTTLLTIAGKNNMKYIEVFASSSFNLPNNLSSAITGANYSLSNKYTNYKYYSLSSDYSYNVTTQEGVNGTVYVILPTYAS